MATPSPLLEIQQKIDSSLNSPLRLILPDKPSTSNLKTRLCKYYLGTNICKNKENCPFAHNPNEINNKKQRLIETCKYAYDLGLLSPTILQSHLSMKPIPIPGINSNSKIYNCAPNPTQICADQEFLNPGIQFPSLPQIQKILDHAFLRLHLIKLQPTCLRIK